METKISIQEGRGVITVDQWDEQFNVRDNHIRMVLDTTDQMIREKLISLGWTPPDVKKAPAGEDRGQGGQETTTKNEPSV